MVKLRLILGILLGIAKISEQQHLLPDTQTDPELFPYHAYVIADLYCLGALISTKFVVVTAICIESRSPATVHLGTRKNPYYRDNDDAQIINSAEVIPHPDFARRYSDNQLVNNIGLIKLMNPAILSPTVRPIALPTQRDFPLTSGTLLNVTGYNDKLFHSNVLRYMTVSVRPQRECYLLYGRGLIGDDERCVKGTGRRLDWTGAFSMNGKLIGLSRVLSREIECVTSDSSCSPRDVLLVIEVYLEWLYKNTDIPYPEPPRTIVIEAAKSAESQANKRIGSQAIEATKSIKSDVTIEASKATHIKGLLVAGKTFNFKNNIDGQVKLEANKDTKTDD